MRQHFPTEKEAVYRYAKSELQNWLPDQWKRLQAARVCIRLKFQRI